MAIPDLVAPALNNALVHVRGKLDEGGSGVRYWRAAEDALVLVRDEGGPLVQLGGVQAQELLEHWAQEKTAEEVEAYLRSKATPAELIASMDAGSERVERETARIRERNEQLLELGRKLGAIGARVVLSLLV